MTKIKEWAYAIIVEWAKTQFTFENFSELLKKIVATVKEKASQTENTVDDWVVNYLEFVVASDDRINAIYNFVKKYVCPSTEGVVQAQSDMYGELALAVGYQSDGVTLNAPSLKSIAELFKEFVPSIIELYSEEGGNSDAE